MEQEDKRHQFKRNWESSCLDLQQKESFLFDIVTTSARYGCPTHRLSNHLSTTSETLEIKSEFFVLPGMILVSYVEGHKSSKARVRVISTSAGFDLAKLAAINQICREIKDKHLCIFDAINRLEEIKNAEYSPFRWHGLLTSPAPVPSSSDEELSKTRPPANKNHIWIERFFASNLSGLFILPVMSFAICVICFERSWKESGFAATLGLMTCLMGIIGDLMPEFAVLMEFSCAFIASFCTRLFQYSLEVNGLGCINLLAVELSGITWLLPGLSITSAVTDLTTKNPICGTVKLFNAFYTAALIGLGLSIGDSMAFTIIPSSFNPPAVCPGDAPSLMSMIALFPLLSFVVNLAFKAPMKQWGPMFCSSALGFTTFALLSRTVSVPNSSIQIPTAVSALAVGLVGNIYSRFFGDIALGALLSGILFLVPGGMGVRSSLGFFNNQAELGVGFVFQLLVIALSITIGLLLASILVFPLKRFKNTVMTY